MNNSSCAGVKLQNSSSKDLQVIGKALNSSLIVNIVLNGLLCYTTTMLNIITIHALRKTSSLSKPLKTLLLNLTVSDLGVGLLGQPLFIAILVEELRFFVARLTTYLAFTIVVNLLCLSSFCSIMALSADRFIAIQMPLRYVNIVSHKRAVTVVTVIWLFLVLFVPCAILLLPQNIYHVIFDIVILVSFVATTFFTCKINFTARRHRIQIQAQAQQVAHNSDILINNARLRKSAKTTFWIYLVFWVCCLPNVSTSIALQIYSSESIFIDCLFLFSVTMVFLNSSLNPVIYSWKMRHIRHTIIDFVQVGCSRLASFW